MHVQANLCSGGLDSYLAWKLIVPQSSNVYVTIGHRYQGDELSALRAIRSLDRTFTWITVEGPSIGHLETPSGIIPCRNALLLLTAAAHIASEPGVAKATLWLGALAGEINSDKSEEFCRALSHTLNVSWRQQYWTEGVWFRVDSPVRHLTKAQLIRQYCQAGHDPVVLGASRSCYTPGLGPAHCGRCPACFKRWVAFRAAAVPDPTGYAHDPSGWPGAALARQKALDGTYDRLRAAETLVALGEAP